MSTKNWQEKFEEEFWGKFGSTKTINEIKQFLSQAIDQTREETIRDIRKHDEEELIKIVDKLKLDVETRIAFKNLKPESVGYNKCALKVQIKIKQIKQLIKDYYAK